MPSMNDVQSAGQQNSNALMVAVVILVVIIIILLMKWPKKTGPGKNASFTPVMQMNPQWQLGSVTAGQAAFNDSPVYYQPTPNKIAPACPKGLVGSQVWDRDNGWSSACAAPGAAPAPSCSVKNAEADSESIALAYLNGGEGKY